MFSDTITAAINGISALIVHVETDINQGLPVFNIVGSPGTEIRESKDRVRAALKNAGFKIPPSRITVNLSPGDLKKDSTSYDLPITIGLLTALEYLPVSNTEGILFLGEIGLNGEIRPVKGVLPIIHAACEKGIKECIIPSENAPEGSVVPGIKVRGADNLKTVIDYLMTKDETTLPSIYTDPMTILDTYSEKSADFEDVCGQERAKRAAVISAAGFHSLLMTGPPGAGKSMIAKRIPGIMPPLTLSESLELTTIYSVAGLMPPGKALITKRAFQSPHHTVTSQALTGGGQNPRPGIISLAHRSVLFLDEFTEFGRDAIESLRQPLEDKKILISRVRYSVEYPADFLLICAMNPCPCGYYPDRGKCRCTENEIRRYLGKISGPILDRIDLCCELKNIDITRLKGDEKNTSSSEMADQVLRAREMQNKRYEGTDIRFNADLGEDEINTFCELGKKEKDIARQLYQSLDLSARSYHRILRVSRTIADIEGSENIKKEHLMEAASYRPDLDYFK